MTFLNQKSKIQQIVEDQSFILKDRLNSSEFHTDGFYDFLLNPKTKKPLQLDILFILNKTFHKNKREPFKQVKLAIEVQGKQHYQWTKDFHKRKSQFHYLKYRDRIKRDLCQQNGIVLIPIKYNDIKPNFNLSAYLINALPTVNYKGDQFLKSSVGHIVDLLTNHSCVDLERVNAFTDFLQPNSLHFEDNILDCLNETLTVKK